MADEESASGSLELSETSDGEQEPAEESQAQ